MTDYEPKQRLDDNVHQPKHYFADNGLEALDVIDAFFHDNYYLGNVFKYIARAGKKDNELEDLQKASVYLEREIIRVCGGPKEPRSWDSLDEVPHDVAVLSSKGCYWKFYAPGDKNDEGDDIGFNEWLWTAAKSPGRYYDKTAPFTEAIS